MKPALDHVMQGRGAVPVALVVGVKNIPVRTDPDAGGRAQPGRPRHEPAIQCHLKRPAPIKRRAAHLGVMHPADIPTVAAGPTAPAQAGVKRAVKIAVPVPHKAKGVFMIIVGQPPRRIHRFVHVGHVVAILIDEPGQFRPLHYPYLFRFLVDVNAQRLVQPIGEQRPLVILVPPHLTFARADKKMSIGMKLHSTHSQHNLVGNLDRINAIPRRDMLRRRISRSKAAHQQEAGQAHQPGFCFRDHVYKFI